MHASVAHAPIEPIPELSRWSQMLRQVAAEPLEFCPDFPAIARRYEAWWRQAADRPVFMAEVNANPARPITRRLDLLVRPEAWFRAKYADLQQTYRVGDTLPNVRADFGAVLLGGLYGGEREESADTSWTLHYIDDDWSNVPDWRILHGDNQWLRLMRGALQRAAQDAPGRYLVCTPDIGSSADTLITLPRLDQAVHGPARPSQRHTRRGGRHLLWVAAGVRRVAPLYGGSGRGHATLLRPVVEPALHAASLRLQRADQPAALPRVLSTRYRTPGRHRGPRLLSSRRPARPYTSTLCSKSMNCKPFSSRPARAHRRRWRGSPCFARFRRQGNPCWRSARQTRCWTCVLRWTRLRWPCWWRVCRRR